MATWDEIGQFVTDLIPVETDETRRVATLSAALSAALATPGADVPVAQPYWFVPDAQHPHPPPPPWVDHRFHPDGDSAVFAWIGGIWGARGQEPTTERAEPTARRADRPGKEST